MFVTRLIDWVEISKDIVYVCYFPCRLGPDIKTDCLCLLPCLQIESRCEKRLFMFVTLLADWVEISKEIMYVCYFASKLGRDIKTDCLCLLLCLQTGSRFQNILFIFVTLLANWVEISKEIVYICYSACGLGRDIKRDLTAN